MTPNFYAYVSTKVPSADVEDVLQETALRCWQHRDDIENAKAYAWQVMRSQVAGYHRQASRQLQPIHLQVSHTVGDVYGGADTWLDLASAIKRLPPRAQQAIQLRLVEGRSYDDLMVVLQVTRVRARVLVCRALKKLRKEMRDA